MKNYDQYLNSITDENAVTCTNCETEPVKIGLCRGCYDEANKLFKAIIIMFLTNNNYG